MQTKSADTAKGVFGNLCIPQRCGSADLQCCGTLSTHQICKSTDFVICRRERRYGLAYNKIASGFWGSYQTLIHIPGDTRIHISRDMVLPKAPYMLAKKLATAYVVRHETRYSLIYKYIWVDPYVEGMPIPPVCLPWQCDHKEAYGILQSNGCIH